MSGMFWSKAGSPIFEVEGRQPRRQRLEPAVIGHAVSGQWLVVVAPGRPVQWNTASGMLQQYCWINGLALIAICIHA
jgi:hypothetical protein